MAETVEGGSPWRIQGRPMNRPASSLDRYVAAARVAARLETTRDARVALLARRGQEGRVALE